LPSSTSGRGKSLHFYSAEVSKKRTWTSGSPLLAAVSADLSVPRSSRADARDAKRQHLELPGRRREWFEIARGFFEKAHQAFPENRIARMYLGEGIRGRELGARGGGAEVGRPAAPRLEGLADIIQWCWTTGSRRMALSRRLGDDCEMWRWWSPVLVGFDDPPSPRQTRFSEALMSQRTWPAATCPHDRRGAQR